MSQAETKAAFSDPVGLNVGGQTYTTSLSTLTKYSESMLGAMFSGRFPLKQDPNGNYFIDRDASLFGYVLEFIRNGQLEVLENERDLHLLLKEAEFFRIPALEKAVKQQIADEAAQRMKGSEIIAIFLEDDKIHIQSISGRVITMREVLHIVRHERADLDNFPIVTYEGQSDRPESSKTGRLRARWRPFSIAPVVQALECHGFVTIKKSGKNWILSRSTLKPGSD